MLDLQKVNQMIEVAKQSPDGLRKLRDQFGYYLRKKTDMVNALRPLLIDDPQIIKQFTVRKTSKDDLNRLNGQIINRIKEEIDKPKTTFMQKWKKPFDDYAHYLASTSQQYGFNASIDSDGDFKIADSDRFGFRRYSRLDYDMRHNESFQFIRPILNVGNSGYEWINSTSLSEFESKLSRLDELLNSEAYQNLMNWLSDGEEWMKNYMKKHQLEWIPEEKQ